MHVNSPVFHGESKGDNFIIVQHEDLGHPLEQEHGEGDNQWVNQKRFWPLTYNWLYLNHNRIKSKDQIV